MNKTFQKWILPVCLLIIICTQLFTYLIKDEINTAFLVMVVALLPAAFKGLEYKISKKLEQVMVIFAGIGMIYVIWYTFF